MESTKTRYHAPIIAAKPVQVARNPNGVLSQISPAVVSRIEMRLPLVVLSDNDISTTEAVPLLKNRVEGQEDGNSRASSSASPL
jgi:hypothetical protein